MSTTAGVGADVTVTSMSEHLPDVERFATVGLDEVHDRVSLLERHDRKYLLDHEQLDHFIATLPSRIRVLELGGRRSFHYESLYFDTPELDSYCDAARRRPRRWKSRLRTYVDSGDSWFEMKLRDRSGRTVKQRRQRVERVGVPLDAGEMLFAADVAVDSSIDPRFATRLVPTLTTRYERMTLVDLADESRITIDVGLICDLMDGTGVVLPRQAIVETKSLGRPCAADRALWSIGRRPLRISKYATGLAAARPELPSNRWHRTLHLATFERHEP